MKSIVNFVIIFFLLLVSNSIFSQTKSGKIADKETLIPIGGATIKNTEGSVLAVSNEYGMFTLPSNMNANKTIVIQMLGYNKKIVSIEDEKSDTISIFLNPIKQKIDEVVVFTGYQSLSKEKSTGSFTHIDKEKFNEQVGRTVLDRLPAIANGVALDRVSSVSGRLSVRGLSTIRGPKEPLIILNNFPYEGNLNNINPNDVESITILKDAAAASIWGARAGNGVIVITTKTADIEQPLTIEVTANATVGTKPDIYYTKWMTSGDMIDVEQMLYNNDFYRSQINSRNKPALSPVVEMLIAQDSGLLDQEKVKRSLNRLREIDVRDELNKYIYKPSINQQYYAGIRSGAKKISWRFAAGFDTELDNLGATYERLNLSSEQTIDVLKNLRFTFGGAYTQSKAKNGRQGMNEITFRTGNLLPYTELADFNHNPLPVAKDWRQSYLNDLDADYLLDWNYYPLTEHQYLQNSETLSDLIFNAEINYKLPLGFEADFKYQYEKEQINGQDLSGLESYVARNLINSYTEVEDDNVVHHVPVGGILDLSNTILQSHNIRGQVNYSRVFNEKHEFYGLIGGEARSAETSGNSSRIYGYDPNNLIFGEVDHTATHPNYITGSSSFIPNPGGLSYTLPRFLSLYSNMDYTYNNKYTLSISARRDASNLFGVNVNNKWTPLWSIGGAWNISNEKLPLFDKISLLKLRATYGYSGNVDPGMSALTTIQYTANSSYTMLPVAAFKNFANPELKWETIGMFNLGIDFSSKNARFFGTIEYYKKNGNDLFGSAPVDITAGIGSSITKNVANITAHGFDVELNSLNFVINKFRWSTQLNLNVNKDKVKQYFLSSQLGNAFVRLGNSVSGVEGLPIYSVFSYKWGGLNSETGLPIGYIEGEKSDDYSLIVGNGTEVEGLVYHGPSLPTKFGSLGNTFDYGNLSFTFRITYKFGNYFRRSTIGYNSLYQNGAMHSDYTKRWQKPGDELSTDVPAMVYPSSSQMQSFYMHSEPFVEKGDHIRLQYINLSYQLNKFNDTRLPFKSARIYFIANNLGIIWRSNKLALDPDLGFTSTNTIPAPKTFVFGIKSTF